MKNPFKTRLKKTIAMVFGLLAIENLPIEDGKLNFTDDQEAKLKEKIGGDMYDFMIKEIEKELTEAKSENEQKMKEAKEELLAVMEEAGFSEEEKAKVLDAETTAELNLSEKIKTLGDQYVALKQTMDSQKVTIENLLQSREDDIADIIKVQKTMKHSTTHIFGSAHEYDSFENRPWNQRLRDGGRASSFGSDELPILKGDAQHFIRTNPTVISSLFDDFEELPQGWSKIEGVEDQYSTASIIPSEVLQGRSKGWNPKGKTKIAVEQMKVYAKKIDITFDGQELQTLENTWIAAVKNLDGSHPWKMSFIFWILSELVKRQKLDERNAMVNGIFAQAPAGDGEEKAGAAVNSQNGLRWWLWYHMFITKKITPFNLGVPKQGSFVEYIQSMIELVPEVIRGNSGWVINLSEKWMKVYQAEAGAKYQHHFSPDEGKQKYSLNHPIDYPNFKFQVLRDYTQTDYIYITMEQNHVKLDYKPNEKNLLTATHEKRNTHFFGDYKSGFGFAFVGTKAKLGEPRDFNKQLIFSNNVPVFADSVAAPFYQTNSGVLKVNYQHMKADASFDENITEIEPMQDDLPFLIDMKGTILKITGNTALANTRNVVHGNNISLAGSANFNLKSGGTLTLYCNPSTGNFVEVSRTTQPEVLPDAGVVEFDDVAIDAAEGVEFIFNGINATTLATILNGTDQQIITIKKTTAAGNLTVSGTGISVKSAAVINTDAKWLKLMKLGAVWYEIDRNI